MPKREYLPVKVTLIVEVDGHALTFTEKGEATGARYHGEDNRGFGGLATGAVLESDIRGWVDTCIGRAHERASKLLQRAYPIYSDKREDTK